MRLHAERAKADKEQVKDVSVLNVREHVQQPERSGVGADEGDKELGRQENCAALEHLEMMSTHSKRATRTQGS